MVCVFFADSSDTTDHNGSDPTVGTGAGQADLHGWCAVQSVSVPGRL